MRGIEILAVIVTMLAAAGAAATPDAPPAHPMPPPGEAIGWHRLHDAPPPPPPSPPPPPLPSPPPPDGSPPAPAPGAGGGAAPAGGAGAYAPAPTGSSAGADAPAPSVPAFLPPSVPAPPDEPAGADITPAPEASPALTAPPGLDAPPWIAPLAPPRPAPSPAASPPPSNDIIQTAPGASGAVVATVALGAAAGAEAGVTLVRTGRLRRWWVWLLAPLYARLRRSEVLESEAREKIFAQIRAAPGASLADLKRALGMANGVLLHHLRTLESNGYVRSGRDERARRFWPAAEGASVPQRAPVADQVLAFVEQHPDVTNAEVAAALAKRPTLIHYHVLRLAHDGKIRRERHGREVHLVAVTPHGEGALLMSRRTYTRAQ